MEIDPAAAQALSVLSGPDVVAALDVSPAMIAVTVGAQHVLVFQNQASIEGAGRRPVGQPFAEAFPEAPAQNLAALDLVLREGRVHHQEPPEVGLLGAAGRSMYLRLTFAPIGRAEDGRPLGVMLTAIDVTARALAHEAALRARLLNELAAGMNEATDPDRALQVLCDALVPTVADVAAVFVLPAADGGTPAEGPTAITVSPVLLQALGPPPQDPPSDEPSPWLAPLTTGTSLLIDLTQEGAATGQSGEWLRAAGGHSAVLLPLVVAGELAGAVVLVATRGRETYLPTDLAFLEQAAARAGVVVSHLRSYRDQRDIALELQRSLLPDVPARLPRAEVAARYVAGSLDVEIGGDWWDVLDLGHGRIGVGVGDVAGRGVHAAVVMGQARAAMRAAALAELPPGRLLTLLDTQLVDVLDAQRGPGEESAETSPRFATAAYAVIDTCAQRIRIANAGHPPMVALDPDGSTRQLVAPAGPPLGLGLAGYTEVELPFPAGTLVAAYTDGLVESRTRQVDDGVAMLCEHLRGLDPQEPLDVAVDLLLKLMDRGSGHDDDVALVLVRTAP